jgi:hypothetical protein
LVFTVISLRVRSGNKRIRLQINRFYVYPQTCTELIEFMWADDRNFAARANVAAQNSSFCPIAAGKAGNVLIPTWNPELETLELTTQ